MKRIRIGIVGVGKIARDQHIPALRSNSAFDLVAIASRTARVEGLANFRTIEEMLDGRLDLDAVTICTPPHVHYEAARTALRRHKHVCLEKPPCATTEQLSHLAHLATQMDRTLFQTWHARHAGAVDAAQRWLSTRSVRKGSIVWKEDVRKWHPGQTWIWQAGGFGVFDAGINAVSILSKIVAGPIFVSAAQLFIPSNCEAPIAANVTFTTDTGAMIDAVFDFRHTGEPSWGIQIETGQGELNLTAHGNKLSIDGTSVASGTSDAEYPSVYRRFADLIPRRESEVDKRPFQLVADIFLIARRSIVEPFVE